MEMNGNLCVEPVRIFTPMYNACRGLSLVRSSPMCFEVRDESGVVVVDIDQWTCSCRIWQVWRLPCKHACACIEMLKKNVYDYCDPLYKVEAYQASYRGIVSPIPSIGMEEASVDANVFVRTPDVRAPTCRRRKKRYQSQGERCTTKCKLCGRPGHNRRTCKTPRAQ